MEEGAIVTKGFAAFPAYEFACIDKVSPVCMLIRTRALCCRDPSEIPGSD
jgi:hypothetical protein